MSHAANCHVQTIGGALVFGKLHGNDYPRKITYIRFRKF